MAISAHLSKLNASLSAYYKPLFRSGSITPLWHGMAAISVTMYCASQLGLKQRSIQHHREDSKKALAEYYEKHGNPHAH
eukprot:CAMPEP_0194209628 /NCGR_PEP_ID=MMETSP0156-20130528/7686_1 /TAXON_ID=33649 /ORGANISM="Thalassionema nitzschioides, Strain L26-B" /LENGTH=78 /DNA_ID=CAMNT_0038936827 /DNA_START=61 /DNA_END=297 /DNA_ORIENTATION=+